MRDCFIKVSYWILYWNKQMKRCRDMQKGITPFAWEMQQTDPYLLEPLKKRDTFEERGVGSV